MSLCTNKHAVWADLKTVGVKVAVGSSQNTFKEASIPMGHQSHLPGSGLKNSNSKNVFPENFIKLCVTPGVQQFQPVLLEFDNTHCRNLLLNREGRNGHRIEGLMLFIPDEPFSTNRVTG